MNEFFGRRNSWKDVWNEIYVYNKKTPDHQEALSLAFNYPQRADANVLKAKRANINSKRKHHASV